MGALKALASLNFSVQEEFLLSLVRKEAKVEQLFESQSIRSHKYFHSLGGLLIFALEDELAEVRRTAILIIRKLAAQNAAFSQEVRDILCYMLNDEADEVRIEAINAIKAIYRTLVLKVDLHNYIFSDKNWTSSSSTCARRTSS